MVELNCRLKKRGDDVKRVKLSLDEQIDHMRDDKGIQFNIASEDSAKSFLTYNNYYFKLKAFAKNYEKYATGEDAGKYVDVDFAYLQELSTLDMYLRKFIIKISLDIEHFLKVKLLNDVAVNPYEDGYDIVQEWFARNKRVEKDLAFKKYNSMCGELICKYESCFAIWNLVEVISFGDFANLYHFYYNKYPDKKSLSNLVFPIKCIRNAAAHNNCLLNSLRKPYTIARTSKDLGNHVAKITSIPKPLRKKMVKNPVIHDFVCTLVVYNHIVTSEMMKLHCMSELHELIIDRFTKHAEYFENNVEIKESFRFVKYVVDHFVDSVYN